jgi:hypothetical protein
MLRNVVLKEDVLMGWVTEIIHAAEADIMYDPLAEL